jgi:hypothetical protein
MERRKGSYIFNDKRITWQGKAQAIHVIADATFTAIRDTRNQQARYYIAMENEVIKAGAVIAARDGAQFTAIGISAGAVEIIF